MVHKPKHKVHSFRGLLGDGGQDEINLERQNVNLAYRIVNFMIMPNTPLASNSEYVSKIYRESTGAADGTVDFSDPDLLAAAFTTDRAVGAAAEFVTAPVSVIFDNVLFSRNIYVTNYEGTSSNKLNYYIEIEEVPVGAATLMQLKLGTARKLGGSSMGN